MTKKVANLVLNDFTNDSRVLKTSISLARFGLMPEVVAMHNVGLSETEEVSGIKVHRIKLVTRPWPRWRAIQALKYLEFIIKAIYFYRKYDVFHCNDLNALPIGILIKLFWKNKKVVYDCHEYQTEINGLKGLEKKVKKWFEEKFIRYYDAIITVSDSIAREYSQIYKIRKPYLVFNCPFYHEPAKHNLFRERLGIRSDQTIFLYQGLLSSGRGTGMLLEAFSDQDSDQNVLVCMGFGPLKDLAQECSEIQDTVYYHPAVSPDLLLTFTSSADYGISFIEDSCLNHRFCLPNKAFEYLMAGLPIVTSNVLELSRFVQVEGVGIVVHENTAEGFKNFLRSLPQQNYKATKDKVMAVRHKYSWEEQEKVIKEIYDNF